MDKGIKKRRPSREVIINLQMLLAGGHDLDFFGAEASVADKCEQEEAEGLTSSEEQQNLSLLRMGKNNYCNRMRILNFIIWSMS